MSPVYSQFAANLQPATCLFQLIFSLIPGITEGLESSSDINPAFYLIIWIYLEPLHALALLFKQEIAEQLATQLVTEPVTAPDPFDASMTASDTAMLLRIKHNDKITTDKINFSALFSSTSHN